LYGYGSYELFLSAMVEYECHDESYRLVGHTRRFVDYGASKLSTDVTFTRLSVMFLRERSDMILSATL